jgi:hypothetical protein
MRKRKIGNIKLYVGRIFSLKNIKRMYAGVSSKELGEAGVMVIDESQTKVLVMGALKNPVWISKFYLHKELTQETKDSLTKEKLNEMALAISNIAFELLNKANVSSSKEEETKSLLKIANELCLLSGNVKDKVT